MTEREAIKDIEKALETGVPDGLEKETLILAALALKKQIPQKVIDKKMFPGNCGEIHVPNFSGKCPSCGHAIIRGVAAHKGCPYCLQALDWSE